MAFALRYRTCSPPWEWPGQGSDTDVKVTSRGGGSGGSHASLQGECSGSAMIGSCPGQGRAQSSLWAGRAQPAASQKPASSQPAASRSPAPPPCDRLKCHLVMWARCGEARPGPARPARPPIIRGANVPLPGEEFRGEARGGMGCSGVRFTGGDICNVQLGKALWKDRTAI